MGYSTYYLALMCLTTAVVTIAADPDCTRWTEWSDCTLFCAGGHAYRARACVEGSSLTYQSENMTCNEQECDGTCSPWSAWSKCTQSCGPDALRLRVRPCIKYVDGVAGQDIETHQTSCVDTPCIDCTGPLCRWIGSLGYHPHPLFCDAYYLCQKVGNHYKKLFKWCETGTVWHHDITACDHPNNVHINSSCTTRPIVQGDDPQFTTKKQTTTTPHPCPFKRVRGNPNKFKYPGHQAQRCPPNQIFNITICGCVNMQDNQPVETVCDNCLFFPFDDHFDDVHCNHAVTTVFGAVTRVPGKKGDGASFDGDSRLVINLFKGWLEGENQGKQLTISVWLKRPCGHFNMKQGLVSDGNCDYHPTVDLHLLNNTVQGGVRTGDNAQIQYLPYDTQSHCDVWFHLAMILNNGVLKLYINGQEVVDGARPGSIESSMVALSLGHTGQNDDEFYKGVMDEIYVCRRAFSAAELQQKAGI